MSFVASEADWKNLFAGKTINVYPEAESYTAKFVEKQTCDKDYDDWDQGTTEVVWVVFQIGSQYYKKFGKQNSYGDVYWTGDCIKVEKKTKTIEVFE